MDARSMQIEFERRLTLMNPELANSEKPDSDTIFSFLYAYTLRFVQQNYLAGDTQEDSTRSQIYSKDVINGLLEKTDIPVTKNTADLENNTYVGDLPNDYFLYVRSITKCENQAIGKKDVIIQNKIIAEDKIDSVLTTAWNKIILPNAYISINEGENQTKTKFSVVCDSYTTPSAVLLTYYRLPKQFNVTGSVTKCELPDSVHMQIVEGAVEMFITENKYRLSSNSKQNKE